MISLKKYCNIFYDEQKEHRRKRLRDFQGLQVLLRVREPVSRQGDRPRGPTGPKAQRHLQRLQARRRDRQEGVHRVAEREAPPR